MSWAASNAAGSTPTRVAPRIEPLLATARLAQARWARHTVAQRLAVLRRFRHRLADCAAELAQTVARPAAETLTSQIIPLADHVRFLERNAGRALRRRRLGRTGRPMWLLGTETWIDREPLGAVLIIAPSNYPIFIPGTQLVQALAAGNAVLLKPAPQGHPAALAFTRLLVEAGLDPDLVQILPADHLTATAAVRASPDKILFTGSSDTGRAVLAASAQHLTPCTLELSGSDPVFVRADAEITRVVRALRFGLSLNDGATCIAPRRVIVHHTLRPELERQLRQELERMPPIPLEARQAEKLRTLHANACQLGAVPLWPDHIDWSRPVGPIVVSSATPTMPLLQADLFAPVLALVFVKDDEQALAAAAACGFALGSSVFSANATAAQSFASRIHAGVVTINDLILPTADPRVPFGGRGASGYGVTRGIEGLLELTRAKVVATRRGRWLPHLDPATPDDAPFFASALLASHGASPWRRLMAGLLTLRLAAQRPSRRHPSSPPPTSPVQPSVPVHESSL